MMLPYDMSGDRRLSVQWNPANWRPVIRRVPAGEPAFPDLPLAARISTVAAFRPRQTGARTVVRSHPSGRITKTRIYRLAPEALDFRRSQSAT